MLRLPARLNNKKKKEFGNVCSAFVCPCKYLDVRVFITSAFELKRERLQMWKHNNHTHRMGTITSLLTYIKKIDALARLYAVHTFVSSTHSVKLIIITRKKSP